MKHVVVIGGGVAGMSAAHELIERGYRVSVYEKQKSVAGGKARSVEVPDTSVNGSKGLPGEHGFRFFPGFYKHITDTMKRIPYKENKNGVLDNLVPTHTIMLARYDKDPILTLDDLPTSLEDLRIAINLVTKTQTGLAEGEGEFFAEKMWQLMTSCRERRLTDYEGIGWWEYMDADAKSQAYRDFFVTGATRSLVAAKAELASTKTVGTVAAQIIFSMLQRGKSVDRVLNGPTNEVWIDPWLDYLRSKGVEYNFGHELENFNIVDGEISSLEIKNLFTDTSFYVKADYYICAIPVDRIAEKLNSEMIKSDNTLQGIMELQNNVEWMNGIQFYLEKRTDINRGHVIYVNTEWALTSISQQQFWNDHQLATYGDGSIKDVLSIDISDWKTPGLNGKTAKECTKEELVKEVWDQLKKSLNVNGKKIIEDYKYVYVDEDIIFHKNSGSVICNQEPLLVNLVNSWSLRPETCTEIKNFFLASDYVKTNTDLASMEGANEAARRAVNGILELDHCTEKKCEIWDLEEPFMLSLSRWYDRRRYSKGLSYKSGLPWYFRTLISVKRRLKRKAKQKVHGDI